MSDFENGEQYIAKVSGSSKEAGANGTWYHFQRVLRFNTSESGYEEIVIPKENIKSLQIVA